MPEMTFRVRWPDGTESDCYSPSLVVHDHLANGAVYPIDEFVRRAHTALTIASERVEARWGRPCALATAQMREIDVQAAHFVASGGDVLVLSMEPSTAHAAAGIR